MLFVAVDVCTVAGSFLARSSCRPLSPFRISNRPVAHIVVGLYVVFLCVNPCCFGDFGLFIYLRFQLTDVDSFQADRSLLMAESQRAAKRQRTDPDAQSVAKRQRTDPGADSPGDPGDGSHVDDDFDINPKPLEELLAEDEDLYDTDPNEEKASHQDDGPSNLSYNITTVWDTKKVRCGFKDDGRPAWFCDFCGGGPWSGHNHTKAQGHLLGCYKDVAPCKKIPKVWRDWLWEWQKRKTIGKDEINRDLRRQDITDGERDRQALFAYSESKEAASNRRNPRSRPSPVGPEFNAPAQVDLCTPDGASEVTNDSSFKGPRSRLESRSFAAVFGTYKSNDKEASAKSKKHTLTFDRDSNAKKKKKKTFHFQTNIVAQMGRNTPTAEMELSLAINKCFAIMSWPLSGADTRVFNQVSGFP